MIESWKEVCVRSCIVPENGNTTALYSIFYGWGVRLEQSMKKEHEKEAVSLPPHTYCTGLQYMYLKSGARSPSSRSCLTESFVASGRAAASSRARLMRWYISSMTGVVTNPMPTNMSMIPSVRDMNERAKKRRWLSRTTEYVTRFVLRAEYVRRDRARKVSDADMERHAHAALVLSSEVVAEPVAGARSGLSKFGARRKVRSHQLTTPGNVAYDPVTQKNVPKYLTPEGASEMLIENPMRSMQSPARMKGERRWMRSDHNAKTYTIVAGAQDSHISRLYAFRRRGGTYWQRCMAGR